MTIDLTADEVDQLIGGLVLLALHHKKQIKDWSIRPRGRDRRTPLVREWADNKDRIVAHHERCIAEASALCGKLGGRDWVAADARRAEAE